MRKIAIEVVVTPTVHDDQYILTRKDGNAFWTGAAGRISPDFGLIASEKAVLSITSSLAVKRAVLFIAGVQTEVVEDVPLKDSLKYALTMLGYNSLEIQRENNAA